MGAAASSSSSSSYPLPPKKYDVFISFRGEDTRANFTSHLYTALCQQSITTYIDCQLNRGDEISQSLLQAIEDSSVSVVVLSENYASSKWCLDELIQILHCREHQGQVVIPVFYKVDPSDVRKQKGTYEEAFAKHERDFTHDQPTVDKWRKALFETANLAGCYSQAYRDESELIQHIVNEILQKLNLMYPSALEGLVGIEENCERIELLLEKSPIIGIWGMGGIGKTTMARTIFAKLSSRYESCCFLENLREESEKHGLPYIREKLLFELLGRKNLSDCTPKAVGSTFGMRRLRSKKVLIVLDDVSSSKELEYLAQECSCLGSNSRVIITTRDKHLLTERVNEVYEAKALSPQESLKLFSFKAFHKDHPEIGYEHLSERVVDYAKGIPLALIVLGSFLRSKTKKEWDSALKKLQKTTHKDIQEVLELSYNQLDHDQREIFLEIACFLKGEMKERVITLLDSYGFQGRIDLKTLEDRALITTTDLGEAWMHDLIQNMGLEIVRQEHSKEPGRRSRLWNSKEVYDVLKNNQGTEAIEGIMLNMSEIRDLYLSTDAFKKMTNLRFLKFYNSRSCSVILPFGLESISNKLRYFHWDKYPLESLPSGFCAEKLVEFHMRNSSVKKLWEGVQDLVNLKTIDLEGSEQLMELPDFSMARNLERVNLQGCRSMGSVHQSILSLPTLRSLFLSGCMEIKSLQSEIHLKSLCHLFVLGCHSLKEFSLSAEGITYLDLCSCKIEILHLPIGSFRQLRHLDLYGPRLRSLPINELCGLTYLETFTLIDFRQVIDKMELHSLFDALRYLNELNLEGCIYLSEIPDNISALTCLKFLSLERTSVESLPSIEHLSSMRTIYLRKCERLRSILGLPPFIEKLDAWECTSLETVFFSLVGSEIRRFSSVEFNNCVKLDEHSLCHIEELTNFSMIKWWGEEACYPGSRVPKWIRYKQSAEASNTIEFTCSFDRLMAVIFCCVLPPFYSMENLRLGCYYSSDDDKHKFVTFYQQWRFFNKLDSDHVFLWRSNIQLMNAERSNDHKLACEFSLSHINDVSRTYSDVLIKACGVCPIYA